MKDDDDGQGLGGSTGKVSTNPWHYISMYCTVLDITYMYNYLHRGTRELKAEVVNSSSHRVLAVRRAKRWSSCMDGFIPQRLIQICVYPLASVQM